MKTLHRFLLAAIGFTLTGCGNVYDVLTKPPPAEGVSLEIKSDLFLAIEATLNDKPVDVLLDTGTVLFNLVPPSAIEEFGLTPAGPNPYAGQENDGVGVCGAIGADATLSEQLYTAARLNIGGVIIENVAFVVLEEEGFNTFESIRVNCILNGALLVQTDWQIDENGRRLTLFPLNTLDRPESPAELRVIGPEPPLFLAIQGAPKLGGISTFVNFGGQMADPIETLMDTGGGIEIATGSRLFDQTGWSLNDIPNIETGLFAAGGTCTTTRFRAPLIELGGQSYEDVHAVTLPDSELGLVGWRFFANHERVRVSPGGQWIEFKKGAGTDDNFATPLMTFGFDLALNADGDYRVKSVTPGLDAEAKGVLVGEIVRAVNGLRVDTLEGKSLLFGPGPMRDGAATFTFENEAGVERDVDITATPLL